MSADASRLRQAVQRWGANVGELAGRDVVDAMRPEVPMGKPDPLGRGYVPGATRRALRYVGGSSDGARHVAHVAVPTKQAEWSDKGTTPHVIVPKGPGYPLRFHWPKAGGVVHLMRVSHPGNEAGHWWEKLLRKHWPGQLKRAARRVPFT